MEINLTLENVDGGNWCTCIQTFANCISALIASISLIITMITIWFAQREYKRITKDKKSEIFTLYNQRYEDNEYIQKIIRFCNTKKENNTDIPTVNDKEMFLRFFEELERMIKNDYISEDDVCEYFSFYFKLLWNDDKNFFWDKDMLEPYDNLKKAQNSIEWKNLNSLYKRIMKNQNSPNINNFIFQNTTIFKN